MAIGIKPSKIPTTIHIQSKSSKLAKQVYDQLLEDYPEDAIKWVLNVKWLGPVEVPLSTIDFSNQRNWQASKDKEHVNEFVNQISNGGFTKPIILCNEPDDNKLLVIDGHHRVLAYKKLGQNPMAFIAHVDTVGGPWDSLHRKQGTTEASSQQSKQKSRQKITKKK